MVEEMGLVSEIRLLKTLEEGPEPEVDQAM